MSTDVVERGLAIGALGIQTRVVLGAGKQDIVFNVSIDATADNQPIFQLMDTISAVAEREQWKVDLAEKRKALRVALEQPLQCLKEIDRLRVEKATASAAQHAMHRASTRRTEQLGEFKSTSKQEGELAQYDAAIKAAELQRDQFMRDVPVIEWEIACLVARIAGEPEPPRPQALDAAMTVVGMAA